MGGPVGERQLLLLVRAKEAPPGSAAVLDGVYMSGSRETLALLLAQPRAGDELRAYAGYAGWASGQLDAEIARGDWLVAAGDAAAIFAKAPERLWRELLDRHQMIRVDAPAKSITLSAPWRSAAASSASRTSARARSSTR